MHCAGSFAGSRPLSRVRNLLTHFPSFLVIPVVGWFPDWRGTCRVDEIEANVPRKQPHSFNSLPGKPHLVITSLRTS